MCFGSGLPVAMISAIAPTYEPVFKRVPIDVLVWSPINEPTLVEPDVAVAEKSIVILIRISVYN